MAEPLPAGRPALHVRYTFTCGECGAQASLEGAAGLCHWKPGFDDVMRPVLPEGWVFAFNSLLCPRHGWKIVPLPE